jgi:arylsulfatase A-like enzyme
MTRVPLVIRFPEGSPSLPPNGARRERISLLDLFPTLVELGVGRGVFQRDLPVMGRSLLERIDDNAFEPVLVAESSLLPAALHDWPDLAAYAKAIYAGEHKLIAAATPYRGPKGDYWPTAVRLGEDWPFSEPRPAYLRLERPLAQLYDLARDPHERHNLAERLPEVVERLRGLVAPNAWACNPLVPAEPPPRFSDEARDTLRALGYVE